MSKLYITGNGADGRSRVVEVKDLQPSDPPMALFEADGPVPRLVTSKTGAQLLSSHAPAGTFRSSVFAWRPGMYTDAHRTISADVDVVLEGSVILELEDGAVTLRKGDVAYLPGTVHTWRATSEPALVLYSIIAAAPSAADLKESTIEPMQIVHGMD